MQWRWSKRVRLSSSARPDSRGMLSLHQADNPRTLHPRSAPDHARGKTHSAKLTRAPARRSRLDYSDALLLHHGSAGSRLFRARGNPSASHGRRSVDTAPASRLPGRREIRIADNSVWEQATRRPDCIANGRCRNNLRWCWWSGQAARGRNRELRGWRRSPRLHSKPPPPRGPAADPWAGDRNRLPAES